MKMGIARVYHRTTAVIAEAILRDGFRDSEGTWGTGELHGGVWVTVERPWDLGIAGPPPGDDAALLVIEIPEDLFTRYEWVQDTGYREALIPAESLNRYPIWHAWECAECDAIAPEHASGWRSVLLVPPHDSPTERVSTCPRCQCAR